MCTIRASYLLRIKWTADFMYLILWCVFVHHFKSTFGVLLVFHIYSSEICKITDKIKSTFQGWNNKGQSKAGVCGCIWIWWSSSGLDGRWLWLQMSLNSGPCSKDVSDLLQLVDSSTKSDVLVWSWTAYDDFICHTENQDMYFIKLSSFGNKNKNKKNKKSFLLPFFT